MVVQDEKYRPDRAKVGLQKRKIRVKMGLQCGGSADRMAAERVENAARNVGMRKY
jgi:hypothetical protein